MATKTTQLTVSGISCAHCKTSIEGALGPAPGVEGARVDVASKTVTVEHDVGTVDAARLIELVEEQGYDVDGVEELT